MHGPSAALLSLPRFHSGIPAKPVIDEGEDGVKDMAAALVHAGILRDSHLDLHPVSLRKAIDAAVQEWLLPYHRQLDLFSTVTCGYTPKLRFAAESEFAPQGYRQSRPAAFLVSNNDEQRESRYIGKAATALQAKRPGLGEDLMTVLHIASTHGLGLYDPATVYGEAQYHFWHGETDIALVADGFRDPEEDERRREANDPGNPVPTDEQLLEMNDIPTPQQFFEMYPKWAAKAPMKPAWSPGRVPTFPKTAGKFRAAMNAANDLADHLRMVRRRWLTAHDREDRRFPNDARRINAIADEVASPLLLRWNYEDWHVRLFDDSFNLLMDEGVADYYLTGVVCFDPRDSADCRDARAKYEALLTTGILTDRLLQLTTTGDEEHS